MAATPSGRVSGDDNTKAVSAGRVASGLDTLRAKSTASHFNTTHSPYSTILQWIDFIISFRLYELFFNQIVTKVNPCVHLFIIVYALMVLPQPLRAPFNVPGSLKKT